MLNLDSVNAAVLNAQDAGFEYFVLVVTCPKTGGVFISVRSQTPKAFAAGLKANSRYKDFGAYRSPILDSMRRHGYDGHRIALHSSHKTQLQARIAKAELVEQYAMQARSLSANRPSEGASEDFEWYSPKQAAEIQKVKRDRAAARKAKASAESAVA